MSDSIELHPEKGVNPRIMKCELCGKDYGVALLGAKDGTCKCKDCGSKTIGSRTRCAKCNSRNVVSLGRHPEHEPVVGGFCNECEAEQKKLNEACRAEVEAGGVYFRCKGCGSTGAIKRDKPLAAEVRRHMKIDAPKPCGVEMDECPNCHKES